jgi:hypothetical protein
MGLNAIKTYLIIAFVLLVLISAFLYYFLIFSKMVPVSNPSFEEGVWSENAIPPNWIFVSGIPENKISWVKDTAHDGDKSVRVDFTGTSWVVVPHSFDGEGSLRLAPFTEYEVSFYVMSKDISKICVGYDERSGSDNSFIQWYSCPGGVIHFPADGKWHKVTHRFNTNKLQATNYGVFKFDISGCDRNLPEAAPFCEGELNTPGTIWIDGPIRLKIV